MKKQLLFFLVLLFTLTVPIGLAQTIAVSRLSGQINSEADEVTPYITKDGLTMYFTSLRDKKDNLYVVMRKAIDSQWSDAQNVAFLNKDDVVGGVALDDRGRIYFATSKNTTMKGDMNIWEGTMEGKTLSIHPLPGTINTINWECQPTITADGNDLYFAAIQRINEKSPSRVELFVSHRNTDGTWTARQNLGDQINFNSYNGTPFISPDGRFLFFTSGDRKRKLYMAERTGPKPTDWSKPVALPDEINAGDNTVFPMIASDGKTLYFASDRPGSRKFDIYQATLPADIQFKIFRSFTDH